MTARFKGYYCLSWSVFRRQSHPGKTFSSRQSESKILNSRFSVRCKKQVGIEVGTRPLIQVKRQPAHLWCPWLSRSSDMLPHRLDNLFSLLSISLFYFLSFL